MKKKNNLKRNKKIFFNYILGPILFIWLTYSIYEQILRQPDLPKAWHSIIESLYTASSWRLYVVFVLMFVNWGLEARKWQLLVAHVQKISFFRSYRAIFTGQAIALNTVNGMGEYVGRVVYLEDGNRIRAISLSIIGSLSQIIVTMVLGLTGLFFVKYTILSDLHMLQGLSKFWLNGFMYAMSLGTLIIVVFYFNLSWITKLLEKIPFVAKYSFYIQKIEDFHWKELTKILILSFVRYIVFVIQYLLLLQLFHVEADAVSLVWMVCVLFLVLAVVPTIPVAELGLRGEASKQLFGLLSTNALGIVFTAVFIWLINRVLPAIAGSLFILGVRLFKSK